MTDRISALTVGGAMIDTIVQIAPERIEQITMTNADTRYLLVEGGRKVEAEKIEGHVGGGAVNGAVSMARLGANTACMVKLGVDLQAFEILKKLGAENVSAEFVIRTNAAPTGASVLISSHERNAGVFTARGSNTLLEEADLADAAFARDLVYITGLSNASADRFPSILRKARASGAFVANNPGIRQLSSRAQPFFENFSSIDLLSVNRSEAAQLVPGLIGRGCEAKGQIPDDAAAHSLMVRGLEAGGFHMDFTAFVRAVIAAGPRVVLVTDGSRGAYAATAEGITHCGTISVKVAGTVGAGDAFASTFSLLTASGSPPDKALRGATFNAASVIESIDTQSGLLSRDALEARLSTATKQPVLTSWPL